MAQFYVAPLDRPWWRRVLDRILRRKPSFKGWTELGWLSVDGLQLGELDDAPPCQDYSAAGRPRYVGGLECPEIRPDFAGFDPSKVTFSAEMKLEQPLPDEVHRLLFGYTAAELARRLAAHQDELIRAAIEEAREQGCGVYVIGEPFAVRISRSVAPNTLIYIPTGEFL